MGFQKDILIFSCPFFNSLWIYVHQRAPNLAKNMPSIPLLKMSHLFKKNIFRVLQTLFKKFTNSKTIFCKNWDLHPFPSYSMFIASLLALSWLALPRNSGSFKWYKYIFGTFGTWKYSESELLLSLIVDFNRKQRLCLVIK